MSRPPSQPVSKPAFILLGAMTAIAFAGPFALALLLSGGERRGWPPDRAIEWAGAGLLLAAFVAVFVACLTVRKTLLRPPPPRDEPTTGS